jgi:hypothetical protein
LDLEKPVLDPIRPVRVFKNWKHNCYNIMQDGRVCATAAQVRLAKVEFLVRDSGRQRMLRGLPKNVHAYAVGYLVDYVHPAGERRLEPLSGRSVFYNPFRFNTFVDSDTHAAVTSAEHLQLDEHGAVYSDGDALPIAA